MRRMSDVCVCVCGGGGGGCGDEVSYQEDDISLALLVMTGRGGRRGRGEYGVNVRQMADVCPC